MRELRNVPDRIRKWSPEGHGTEEDAALNAKIEELKAAAEAKAKERERRK